VDSSNLYPVHVSYEITYLYGFALSVSAADSSGTGGKFILELEAENSGSDTATSSTDTVFDSGMSVGSVSMSVKVYDNNNELVNSYDLTEAEMYDLTGIDPNGLFEMQ
jgi:hypothetical protein